MWEVDPETRSKVCPQLQLPVSLSERCPLHLNMSVVGHLSNRPSAAPRNSKNQLQRPLLRLFRPIPPMGLP
jgi:hypothetical protein